MPNITMRATQLKMISRAVTSTWFGYQARSSGVLSGQPRMVNGQRPLENQVSSVSGSRVSCLSAGRRMHVRFVSATVTWPFAQYQTGKR